MDLNKIRKAHFIGIGGIAVSADAKLMLGMGKYVTGSDVNNSEDINELKKMGINVFIGHSPDNIENDTDLVIYSPAVPDDNVERLKAKELRITELSHPEFLGLLSKKMWTIAVSGTKGKSTTTSMLGLILEKSGFDPTVIVGSKVGAFEEGNLRLGKREKILHCPREKEGYFDKDLLVVEACEYKAAMVEINPKMIILTNIKEDHLDYYKDLNHIKEVFKKYINNLAEDGILIYNKDDEASLEISRSFFGKKISYRISSSQGRSDEVIAKNIRINKQKQVFEVWYKGKSLGEIKLNIPGRINIYNALAAIAASIAFSVDFKIIQDVLGRFKGIWRRFEIIGRYKGALIISDYAHNPMSVEGTIEAAKEFYPHKRIVVVFQPHSWNRTKTLFKEFVQSFDEADFLILAEVYEVEGREDIKDKISSKELADAIREMWKEKKILKEVIYAKDLNECKKIILRNIKKNDVVIIMGAGDIYTLKIIAM